MLPLFNPYLGTPPPASRQVPQPNTGSHVNPANTLPNPSQMGILNPQSSSPFIPNMPNQFGLLPLQNNLLGMPHMGSAQPHLGSFNPQNCVQNLGPGAFQSNPGQPANLFAPNSVNLPGNFQNFLPNMNQNFPTSMPNLNQIDTYNVLLQLAQALGPQNPSFMPNQQFVPMCINGVGENVHQDNNKLGPPTMGSNALKQPPVGTQQLQRNWSAMSASSGQPQQNWKNQQPSNFMKSQGNLVKDVGVNNSNSNWKNSSHKNFVKNPKGKNSHWSSRKSQSHHMQNARGAVEISNKDGEKGRSNMAGNFCPPNFTNQDKVEKRRPLPLNYTEQEIQNWRAERKKNYPSKANLEKNSTKKLTNSMGLEAEAKSRRQQLKEILAKQAELGVEVAEIPPHYLSDSEKQQVHGREENNNKAFGKKERFQNRGNKRRRHDRKHWRRHDQEDGFTKKQRLAGNDSGDAGVSNQPPPTNKKQTLLQKLLSSDIKRDKRHLLQVFRFMVMNSFFIDCPEKPLKFPLVAVKETRPQGVIVNQKSLPTGDGLSQGIRKASAEEFSNVDEEDEDDGANYKDDAQAKETGHSIKAEGRGGDEIEKSEEEEEGEIID